ncbi:60Kd inner membrane protein-domain-containing protein [Stachybotrys elegans]|uniref:60Kd inner membrane protein-domain-containing protein n=1 Tax=Stachybotrys elegans TaxID=80388 RepID=A0A8K0SRE1_9HYPO|nr:60Kd inner membrane protein-domain-containing protein [Stachybotrys elegans]
MLPGRGIARALPSGRACQSLSSRYPATSSIVHGRQFGTSLRSSRAGLITSSSLRIKLATPAIGLGSVSSSRNLSLWGYGSSSKPAEAPKPVETAAPEPFAANSAPPAPEPPAPSTATDLSSVTPTELDLAKLINEPDVTSMPETLGYLHNLGLDYGWGPTSTMQWLLEHVHVMTGLDWSMSIIVSALIMRTILLYPTVKASVVQAKMAKLKADPRSQEATRITTNAWRNPATSQEEMMRGRYLNKMLMKEYGVSNWALLWSFLPIPFSIGFFRILNGMASIPVPGLEQTSFLWIDSIASADPYYILPALSSILMGISMRANMKYTPPQQRAMMGKMAVAFGVLGFGVTVWLSAAVNIMTVTVGATMILTTWLTNNAAFRRMLGIEARETFETPSSPEYQAPRKPFKLGSLMPDMKKALNDQVSSMTGMVSNAMSEAEKAEKKRAEMIKELEASRKKQEREAFDKKYRGP